MNVGISFDEDYLKPDGDIARYWFATGWDVSDAGGLPSPHLREYLQTMKADGSPHGQTFHHVSTNTDVLGWLFERVCPRHLASFRLGDGRMSPGWQSRNLRRYPVRVVNGVG